MANIQIISNFDQPIPGEPGGNTNTGGVEWLSSVYLDFNTGWDTQAKINQTSEVNYVHAVGERLLWMHNFDYYVYTFNQTAYNLSSNTTQGSKVETQTLSVMAPWTMSYPGRSSIWHSTQGTKLLVSSGANSTGTNPAAIVSISLNKQFIESSISKAQLTGVTGITSSSWAQRLGTAVSPNGQHIIAEANVSQGNATKLFKVNFDVDHYLTGLTQLASPISAQSFSNMQLFAVTNTHIFTLRIGSSPFRYYIDKRDINTGIVTATITHADWNQSDVIIEAGATSAKIFGNALFFVSFAASGAAVKKARIWKINLNSESVSGYWDVSAPPIDQSFTPGQYLEPNQWGWTNLRGIDIDDSGIVYLNYAADYTLGPAYSWDSQTRPMRRRIHRARLT